MVVVVFSSKTRGFVVGGNTPDGYGLNVIQFVTIATAGNAQDFGDVGYSQANPRGFLIIREVYILVVKVQVLLIQYKQH